MQLQFSKRIERQPADVFDFVAVNHFHNHPRWDPNVIEMTQLGSGPLAAGARARVQRKRGGKDEVFEVVEFEPPRRFVGRDNIGPFLLVVTCIFEPAGEHATTLRLTSDTTAASGLLRLVLHLMKPMIRSQVSKSLDRIKAMVEQEYGATPIADRKD